MSTQIMDFIIIALQWVMTLGIAVLAILLFWHLRRINKPVLAFIFWCVMFLTAATPLLNIIQSGVPFVRIPVWYIGWIVLLPLIIIAVYFANPLKPKTYSYQFSDKEDHDDDRDDPTYH